MRIVSGKARGCKLFSLEGSNTRPTTDRVKEAMFSMIQFEIAESTVLDLFSGSGALGIEALSRGAARCDFVEQYAPAAEIIRKNIEKSKLGQNARLYNTAAERYLDGCREKYDIIFLDPPYNKGLCEWAITKILKNKLAADNAIFVCETSDGEPMFSESKRKVYGKTAVTVVTAQQLLNKEDLIC